MNKENCALKLVDEIILYYDGRSKKHQILLAVFCVTDLSCVLVEIEEHMVSLIWEYM